MKDALLTVCVMDCDIVDIADVLTEPQEPQDRDEYSMNQYCITISDMHEVL